MGIKNSDDGQGLCTVIFQLKKGHADAGRFIYLLACRVEQWADIEVVSLQVGNQEYVMDSPDKNAQGADHEQ